MDLQTALMLFFVIVTIFTNGYIKQTRLDKIIELLGSIEKVSGISADKPMYRKKKKFQKTGRCDETGNFKK